VISVTTRPGLDHLGLAAGKKTRLHRILYRHGLGNGTAIFLPYDQGLEHGRRDFFANPAASDPRYVIRLALEGGFNGIAIQVGLAEKFYWDYAGEIPLILKLNGKTDIPDAIDPLSPVDASVADAVRLGADAVGYTLYVGSPAQEHDFRQYLAIRDEARQLGMPLIVWSYPRGTAIDGKGGKDSFYAVDYAARTASELGADVVKVNFPNPEKQAGAPAAYQAEFGSQQAIDAVVRSANRTLLLVSGGEKAGDAAMLEKARQSMEREPQASYSAAMCGSASTPSRCGSRASCAKSWPSIRRDGGCPAGALTRCRRGGRDGNTRTPDHRRVRRVFWGHRRA
jgi:fructose-bisphosphate aldolase, class I